MITIKYLLAVKDAKRPNASPELKEQRLQVPNTDDAYKAALKEITASGGHLLSAELATAY